jgi:hypothetical protein
LPAGANPTELRYLACGTLHAQELQRLFPNAGLYFVGISSDNPITQIVWRTSTTNDGYGLDDFSTVTRVFEPPTMLILGMSLVGIAGVGRKKLLKK